MIKFYSFVCGCKDVRHYNFYKFRAFRIFADRKQLRSLLLSLSVQSLQFKKNSGESYFAVAKSFVCLVVWIAVTMVAPLFLVGPFNNKTWLRDYEEPSLGLCFFCHKKQLSMLKMLTSCVSKRLCADCCSCCKEIFVEFQRS